MNFMKRQIILLLAAGTLLLSGEKKVLLEMFTNAHCYSCVAGYELFRQFRMTSVNSSRVSYVMYHITQPGVEDSIYFENRADSDQRNAYYGSHTAVPLLFIDGTFTGSNTKTWRQYIDTRFPSVSPFTISLKGTVAGNKGTINAQIHRDGAVADNDLRLHIILTESVSSYIGKNGVSPQIFAMRKMLGSAAGEAFSLPQGETTSISRAFDLMPNWDNEKLWVTVFIQSGSKKTVYQSEMISTTLFTLTSAPPTPVHPFGFSLSQNYPNPFNPTTMIEFSVSSQQFITLSVVDVMGKEIAQLVRETVPAGKHTVSFDASTVSSGLYFYRLQSRSGSITRKMLLIR
jgi:hypothetical protein